MGSPVRAATTQAAAGTGAASVFHALRVDRVVRETPDASSFAFDLPEALAGTFAYRPGQFCTFRAVIDGVPHNRCYSMSSAPATDDLLQVTVKRVAGGLVSNWMHDHLAEGDVIDVAPPAGRFLLDEGEEDLLGLCGGSGITPVFSIVKTALATTDRRVRLLYANRDRDSIIFRRALDELAARHPDRLAVHHHLDSDDGLVQPEQVAALLDPSSPAQAYLCGPDPFMDLAEGALLEAGLDRSAIHLERFTPAEEPPPPPEPDAPADGIQVTIELDGRTEVTEHHPGATLLQTARQVGLAPPYSCELGNCATCMAKLVAGDAKMHANNALLPDEVEDGWVLTCQAVPTTPAVHVVYGAEED